MTTDLHTAVVITPLAGTAIDITTLPTDLKTIMNEPGVKDLSMGVKGPFCQAIRAERQGNPTLAQQKLEEAVLKENA